MTQPSGPTAMLWALLVTLGVIWGASFLSVRIALDGFGPLTIAAIRIVVAAVILTGFALVTGRAFPPFPSRVWAHIAGFAIFSNALPFTLLSWGQQHVASGFAGITMAVVPLLVLPLAHVFVAEERMNRAKVIGFAAGFVGVVILIGPGAFASAGGDLESLARLACVAASACYATGSIITRTAPPASMVAYAAGSLIIASAIMLPVALIFEGVPTVPAAAPLTAIAYLAIAPTALATLIMVHIIRNAGSSFLSLVNYQVPIWSVIFGAVVLAEALPGRFLFALGLILAGLALSQFAMRRASQ